MAAFVVEKGNTVTYYRARVRCYVCLVFYTSRSSNLLPTNYGKGSIIPSLSAVSERVLCCVPSTGKDYPIQASTKDEMLVWVKAIEDAKVRFATLRVHEHVSHSTLVLCIWVPLCNLFTCTQ